MTKPIPILIGPFTQLLTMKNLPQGSITDNDLEILQDVCIVVKNGMIDKIGKYTSILQELEGSYFIHHELSGPQVAMPGLVDCHTHICHGGHRARDYALRNSGSSYLEIAANGGGIWDTVNQTRACSQEELTQGIIQRANQMAFQGVTTIEVKSGYGLSVAEELKMLRAIKDASDILPQTIISTCLAAHIIPKDSTVDTYLKQVSDQLFPVINEEKLATRVDAFVEKEAYQPHHLEEYFTRAKSYGWDITLHADQFTPMGSALAIKYGAISADHLEASTDREVEMLAQSKVIPVALPGASIGLGCDFTPARKLLDAGCNVAIASDYNPGSAPMGDLLAQACILGTFQKLSNAEVLAGITTRAAAALNINKIGRLEVGAQADFIIFNVDDYQKITYRQGQIKPHSTYIKGQKI